MNRKLLFFDIDGTLLAGGIPGYIPDSAMEALTQAQANGHYIFINSGRTYGFMPEAIKEFPFDGYVCGCGTEVIFHGETLYHYDLDDSLKRSLDEAGICVLHDLESSPTTHYSAFTHASSSQLTGDF